MEVNLHLLAFAITSYARFWAQTKPTHCNLAMLGTLETTHSAVPKINDILLRLEENIPEGPLLDTKRHAAAVFLWVRHAYLNPLPPPRGAFAEELHLLSEADPLEAFSIAMLCIRCHAPGLP